MNHSNTFYHRHTIVNSSRKQQQRQQQNSSSSKQQRYMAGHIYKCILVRRAAAYSIIIIDQVQVLRCETAQGVYVTRQRNNNSYHNTQGSYSSGSWLLDCADGASIVVVHIFQWNKRGMSHKNTILDSNHGRRSQGDSIYRFTYSVFYKTIYQIDLYLYMRTNRRLGKKGKKRKQHSPLGNNPRTVCAASCRIGRGEQGEARKAISAPRGWPHLDPTRLRLKTWYTSDFSISGTTRAALSSISL